MNASHRPTPSKAHRERIQHALDQAASELRQERDVALASLETARVLHRIQAQRQRLGKRLSARAQQRNVQPALSAMGVAESLFLNARDRVYRHPIAIGLALGAVLALGPRRLRRFTVWAAPLAWRGWRMAERAKQFAQRSRL
ncbi:hypothetical protein EBQ26_08590 [Allofranklinella schreckenbergeri]|uniref:YqjK-like protein n=1 Tax=Allofranklinella schreckenbergeri TaxID=1076744 RepID=A0A3M6Q0S1_9BURK|nr:hypothetical protein [Allofranklinella schreckenbergeri]RMW96872.1 hypothetical protein EBQ26_08590 [Allofranklinella schreckenbergeri]